jgi:hypothetical protein
MTKWIEKSVFFRPFNYLRISHPYALRYNWVYPIALCLALFIAIITIDTAGSAFQKDGLISSFTPLLSILAPFYIGALGAVATFSGNTTVDQKFAMSKPVRLNVIGSGGSWENIDVTPRHFLSLLFGYSTAISIFLVIFSIFSPILSPALIAAMTDPEWVFKGFLAVFLFLFSQVMLGTLLGVYFLADQLHRK